MPILGFPFCAPFLSTQQFRGGVLFLLIDIPDRQRWLIPACTVGPSTVCFDASNGFLRQCTRRLHTLITKLVSGCTFCRGCWTYHDSASGSGHLDDTTALLPSDRFLTSPRFRRCYLRLALLFPCTCYKRHKSQSRATTPFFSHTYLHQALRTARGLGVS